MNYCIDENGKEFYLRGVSGQYERECPNCAFERGFATCFLDTRCEFLLCYQCGYKYDEEIDEENSDFPSLIVWAHTKCGGEGACYFVKKSEPECQYYRSVNKKKIKHFQEHILEYNRCRYTFKKDGKWFIRDLIFNKTMPFSYKKFIYNEEV